MGCVFTVRPHLAPRPLGWGHVASSGSKIVLWPGRRPARLHPFGSSGNNPFAAGVKAGAIARIESCISFTKRIASPRVGGDVDRTARAGDRRLPRKETKVELGP